MPNALNTDGATCVIGVTAERRNLIKFPHRLTCDGCGTDVYVSQPLLEPARRHVESCGLKLYITCPACAEPFLELVGRGDACMAGPAAAVEEFVGDVQARRRRFLAGLN